MKRAINFLKATISEQECEILIRKRECGSSDLTVKETMQMYANKNNWDKIITDDGIEFVWKGPIIYGYSGAERALVKMKKYK